MPGVRCVRPRAGIFRPLSRGASWIRETRRPCPSDYLGFHSDHLPCGPDRLSCYLSSLRVGCPSGDDDIDVLRAICLAWSRLALVVWGGAFLPGPSPLGVAEFPRLAQEAVDNLVIRSLGRVLRSPEHAFLHEP